jgi:cardiolipin synthase
MSPFYRKWSLNLRNHRKAIVVDERVAVVGGMNLGDEYMGPDADPNRWVDNFAVLEGPAVSDVVDQFFSDWAYATNEQTQPQHIDDWKAPFDNVGAMVQVIPSGPDVSGDPLYAAMIGGILNARERVWIVTPYFVPDDGLMKALGVAARMGLDVRLIVPDKSNHFAADITRGNFIRRLKADGVRVYYYTGGMLHAKNVVIDHDFTVVGSVNFDVRSLFFNFELAMFIYSEPEVGSIAGWMEEIMAHSEVRGVMPASPFRRFLEQLFFLVSPML